MKNFARSSGTHLRPDTRYRFAFSTRHSLVSSPSRTIESSNDSLVSCVIYRTRTIALARHRLKPQRELQIAARLSDAGAHAMMAIESYMLKEMTRSQMESVAVSSEPSPAQKVWQNHRLSHRAGSPIRLSASSDAARLHFVLCAQSFFSSPIRTLEQFQR